MSIDVTVTLPAELAARLKARAQADGASEATIIRDGLDALDGLAFEAEDWLRREAPARLAALAAGEPTSGLVEAEARILGALRGDGERA